MNDIIPVGIAASKQLTTEDRVADLAAESLIQGAVSFEQLLKDFVLFHAGLLMCCPGMVDDPIQMYVAHAVGNPQIGVIHTQNQMFSGASPLTRAMWFCAIKDWPGLRQFLGSFGVSDPVKKTAFTTFWHSIHIPDMRALESGKWDAKSSIPYIPVEVIGMSGHNHEVFYASAAREPFSKPVYRIRALTPEEGAPVTALISQDIDETWTPNRSWVPPTAPVAAEPSKPMSTQELIDAWKREFGQPD